MSRMSRKKKNIFITVGILFNILLCAGIFINYEMNKVVDKMNTVLLKDYSAELAPDVSGTGSQVSADDPEVLDWRNYHPDNSLNGVPGGNTTPSKTDIMQGVEGKLKQPVEKKDLLKAGMIIMRKLDAQEINYLYGLGTKDKRTAEDIKQAKKILQDKLTAEDLNVLYELGLKYGKKLSFLKQ